MHTLAVCCKITVMRILYALNSKNPGGMEQHVLDLVNQMVGRDHEVFVWCGDGQIAKWYREAGADVTTKKANPLFGISGMDIDLGYILALTKFLKNNKIDVLHAHEPKAIASALIAGFLGSTKVKITHTHTPISEWPISQFKAKVYNFVYSMIIPLFVDYEIALTPSRKRVKMKEGMRENKLYIIPNGLDTQQLIVTDSEKFRYKAEMVQKYKFPKEKFIFGYASRMTAEKGHETLIRAFAKLLEYKETRSKSVHLLLAGGGEMEDDLKKLTKELGVEDFVTITKRYPKEDTVKLYSSFDAFVFPTLAEGFGIVLLEAMASGLPIICSNLEVLEEVAGSTVFSYFETGDPQNLAEKMHELYMKRNRLDVLKDLARQRVLDFYTLKHFGDEYEKLYLDTLERKSNS